MNQFDSPKPGANITLVASNGERIQGQYVSVLAGDWNIAVNHSDIDWLYSVVQVDINFIMNSEVCSAKADISGVDSASGRCLLVNIHNLKSRPLRGQDRVDVDINCAVILQAGQGRRSEFISSGQNSLSNISRTGALLSINREVDISQDLLLLFALDGHPDLTPPDHRIFVSGRIVREAAGANKAYRYHYGILFSSLPPDFLRMLSTYVDHVKLLGAKKGAVA